jgi:hypothetical protein
LRLESIFNSVDCKNKEINNNLLKKNNNIIQTSRSGFNNNLESNTPINKNYKETFFSNYSQNKKSLDIITLRNNLKFTNLNIQNNLLLKKKHRMDTKLQKCFDTDFLTKQNKNFNMHTGLNLLNNKTKINIKKSEN